jgi:6-phosphogluconolactonase
MEAHLEAPPTTQPEPPPTSYVYVASARGNAIAVFALGADDGRLELLQQAAIPAGVTPLAVDPGHRYLYAGLRGDSPSVIAFAINPSHGLLSSIGRVALGDPPMYLATDATGRFLLSASYAGGTFSINAITQTTRRDVGEITAASITQIQTPPQPHSILTDPTNHYLFVASLGGNVILQYLFDASTGAVLPNAEPFVKTSPSSGPRHMVFHPNDPVLFVNGELDGSICSYALSAETGRLRALHRALMLPETLDAKPWAGELAIGPDGRYLYASERRTSTLAIFDLCGEAGSLRRRDIVATEAQPRSFAIDPLGRFLIVAGELSNHLTVYRIDPSTGALDPRNRYAVGEKPTWVTIVSPLSLRLAKALKNEAAVAERHRTS